MSSTALRIIVMAAVICTAACSEVSGAIRCSSTDDKEVLYFKFWEIISVADGLTATGWEVRKEKSLTPEEAEESKKCLFRAVELNSCSALSTLKTAYIHGMLESNLGIKRDAEKAKNVSAKFQKCRNGS